MTKGEQTNVLETRIKTPPPLLFLSFRNTLNRSVGRCSERLVVRVVARSTTIGEDRTTSGSHKRSIVRSIVAPHDRSYDQ